ncbi:MAG: hypothetical protein ACM3SW_20815 [Actinomycetota bacterium]
MRNRRSAAAFLIILGLFGMTIVMRNPRFAAFHAADVLQILASGACFGVGFALLFGRQKVSQ